MNEFDRAVLFWCVCIPTRIAIAQMGSGGSPFLRTVALLVALNWLSGNQDSKKGFFGGPVWWARQRGLHGFLWLMFAITGNAWFLHLDVAIGAMNWVVKKSDPVGY